MKKVFNFWIETFVWSPLISVVTITKLMKSVLQKKGDSKEKKVVSEKEEVVSVSEQCSDSARVKSGKGFSEAMKEIQVLFEKASESGNPVLEMLDVGKLRYHRKFDPQPEGSLFWLISNFLCLISY